jgi:hypothetical protein
VVERPEGISFLSPVEGRSPAADNILRTLEITFCQMGSHGAIALLARLFREGWETLEPTTYRACGHYTTTLYLPDGT